MHVSGLGSFERQDGVRFEPYYSEFCALGSLASNTDSDFGVFLSVANRNSSSLSPACTDSDSIVKQIDSMDHKSLTPDELSDMIPMDPACKG